MRKLESHHLATVTEWLQGGSTDAKTARRTTAELQEARLRLTAPDTLMRSPPSFAVGHPDTTRVMQQEV